MCQAALDPVQKRSIRRMQVLVAGSLIGYLACSQASVRLPDGNLALVLAALSGLFFFGELIGVSLMAYRRFDEFQRVLLLRSFLWATALTLGLTFICGFLELHAHNAQYHVPLLAVPALLIFFTTAAKVLIFRQNRSARD